jgi:hypothetical protein
MGSEGGEPIHDPAPECPELSGVERLLLASLLGQLGEAGSQAMNSSRLTRPSESVSIESA